MANELTTFTGISQLFGSFWTETYPARSQALAIAKGVAELSQQAAQDTQELINAVSRETIDPDHRERWYPLVLRRSELNATTGSILRYGTSAVYGEQPSGGYYYFGVPTTDLFKFPIPANLKAFAYMANRIGTPGKVWIPGVDIMLTDDVLIFRENPFDDPAVAIDTVPLSADSDVVATLWLCDAMFDTGNVYTQFGFVHNIDPSLPSQIQRDGVLAVSRSIVGGTSQETLKELLSAGTGVPHVLTDEIVVDVISSPATQVITDKTVHTVPTGSQISYTAGDIIPAGAFVTDDVALTAFSRDIIPNWLYGLHLTAGLVDPKFGNNLALVNEEVPVLASTLNGNTYVEFPLGVDTVNAKRFFDEVHTRGIAGNKLLAEYLEDAYEQLPHNINPLQFFITNWFRGTLLVVHVSNVAVNNDKWLLLQHLRRITPPNLVLVILIDIAAATTGIVPGDGEITSFTTLGISSTIAIDPPIITASIRNVQTTCES